MRVELESDTTAGVSSSRSSATMEKLYARHVTRAIRLAYLITGERDASEDIAQDAFIRVFGRWRHLRRRESFEAYLRKAVINGARSHLRRRGVRSASWPARPASGRMKRRNRQGSSTEGFGKCSSRSHPVSGPWWSSATTRTFPKTK
jgi:DNA-directed RNA polymerase specialized sigma24 family protein